MLTKLLIGCGLVMVSVMATAGSAPERSIWMAPRIGEGGAGDYMALFDEDAPWGSVAQAMRGFEISVQHATYRPESELRTIFAGLDRLGIGLGIGLLAFQTGPGRCGESIEGNSAPGQSQETAERVRRFGGRPAFYGMDEPLFFGAFYVGAPEGGPFSGCRYPIPELAEDVARHVREVRSVFPGVAIGDVEPLAGFSDADGPAHIEHWLVEYERAVGDKLAFMRFDVDWAADWRTPLGAIAPVLARHGIPLQIIFNGRDNDPTDAAWIAHAKENIAAYEAAGLPPAAPAFQTWVAHPSHVLPETDPLSLTGLARWYLERQTGRK